MQAVYLTKKRKLALFLPVGLELKEKIFAILDRTLTRIEGTQANTKESDKIWFVCHLEIISKNILDDLIFAKNLMVKCFSPYYEVFRNHLNMYHKALV